MLPPGNLPPTLRAEAFWTIARLQYTIKDFSKAYSTAKKALSLIPNNADYILRYSIYACLSGKTNEALQLIDQAVRLNPDILGIVVTCPEIQSIRSKVIHKLSLFIDEVNSKLQHKISVLEKIYHSNSDGKHYSKSYAKNLNSLQAIITNLKQAKAHGTLKERQAAAQINHKKFSAYDYATERLRVTQSQKLEVKKKRKETVSVISIFSMILLGGISWLVFVVRAGYILSGYDVNLENFLRVNVYFFLGWVPGVVVGYILPRLIAFIIEQTD